MKNQTSLREHMTLQIEFSNDHVGIVDAHSDYMPWVQWCIDRGHIPNTINEWQSRKGIKYLVAYICGLPAESSVVVVK